MGKNKKNPRKVTWTILYRRKNKKGTMTEIDARKRSRRALKTNRGVAGQSWAQIQAKKTVKPEVRKAARDAAVQAAKSKKKTARKLASGKAAGTKQQVNKNVQKQKARVGG